MNSYFEDVFAVIKTILFISHELTYTGAPIMLLNLCKVAKELGYGVDVWSMKDGALANEFKNNDINIRVANESTLMQELEAGNIEKYEFAVCNTIITYRYAKLLETSIPVLWWIHEGEEISGFLNSCEEVRKVFAEFKNVYCVSEQAKWVLEKYRKYPVKILYNSIVDYADLQPVNKNHKRKIRFCQIGSLIEIKGYDILLEAFSQLVPKYKKMCELYILGHCTGSRYSKNIEEKARNLDFVHYLGEMNEFKEKINILSEIDVLVVSSRSETCSLTALEGAMLSKPLIVTDKVGAKYIVSNDNGLVVRAMDVKALRLAMEYMIDNASNLFDMGKKSREMYERMASMERMKKDFVSIVDDMSVRKESRIQISEYLFPYYLFNRNEKILIYGLNKIGISFWKQTRGSDWVDVIAILGENGEIYNYDDVNKISWDDMMRLGFDSILVAVISKDEAKSAVEKLVSFGIRKEIIKWDGLAYSRNGFFSRYINLLSKCVG